MLSVLAQSGASPVSLMRVVGAGVVGYCVLMIALFWAYARTRLYPLYVLKILWVSFTFVGFFWLISMSLADPGPRHGGVASEFMKNPAGPFDALSTYADHARRLYQSSPWWIVGLFGLLIVWRGLIGRPAAGPQEKESAFHVVLRLAAAAAGVAAGVQMLHYAGSMEIPFLSARGWAGLLLHPGPLPWFVRYPAGGWFLALPFAALLAPRRWFGWIFVPASVVGLGLTMVLPGGAGLSGWWLRFTAAGATLCGLFVVVGDRRVRRFFLPVSAVALCGAFLLLDRGAEKTHLRYTGAAFFLAGCGLWALLPLGLRRRWSWAGLLLLGLLAAAPLGWSLADFDWTRYTYGVQNYVFAWKTAHMGKYMGNSLMVSLLTVGVTSLCASMAAYALTRFGFVGRNAVLYGFIGAMVIPAQLYIVPLFLMIRDWSFTLGPLEFSFMDSRLGLGLIYAAAGLPFAIFLLTGFYRTLPGTLREAAAIDGCSEWRIFTDVFFPLAAPGLATAAIFQFLGVWNEYQFALVFLTNDRLKTLPVGLYNLSVSQQYAANWSALFAGVTILCLPTFLIFVVLQERIVAGLTVGAVKE